LIERKPYVRAEFVASMRAMGVMCMVADDRWQHLARRSPDGEARLRARGLDPVPLIASDSVRFGDDGISIPLFCLATSVIHNVVTRRNSGEPKVLGMRGCTTRGSLVGRVPDIEPGGADVVVITEGVFDTLTGLQAFDGCRVLGCNGASMMPSLVEAAAPRVAAIGGWMLIVPHADADERGPGAGERAAVKAARIAIAAGLVLGKSLRLVDLDGHKDLNDAWRAGWRWTW
jgi:hypothetical protein